MLRRGLHGALRDELDGVSTLFAAEGVVASELLELLGVGFQRLAVAVRVVDLQQRIG